MEKKWFVVLFFGIFFVLNLKFSYAVGLSPAVVNINFEPGLTTSIKYNIYEENPEKGVEIYVGGELAKYVELDKKNITGGGSFIATIKLPDKIDTPGKNRITIGVREKPPAGGGIGTITAINGAIFIFVPYPGKYAEIESFSINDVNTGEELIFMAEISSLGEEDIVTIVNTDLSVYGGKYIETFVLGSDIIKAQEKKSFQKIINSSKYGPGYYNVTAILDYGTDRIVKKEKYFRIGSLFVEILNWTKESYSDKINKFSVEVESDWNNKIENIYAHVSVYDKENESEILTEFKTISESLERWQRKNLTGYLDTTNIKPGLYKTNITVFYETESTTEITEIVLKRKIRIWLIISGIIAIIILVVGIFIIVKIIKNRRKRKVKK